MQNRPIKTIFVCEFITGGGFNHLLLDSTLVNEGRLMRDALLNDLSALPYNVVTTLDARLPVPNFQHRYQRIHAEEDAWAIWESIVANVDAVWFVAPETNGYLHQLTALAIKYQKYILGCGIKSIGLCGSKYDSYQFFKQKGIEVVETIRLSSWINAQSTHWIVKPDDGAGCDDVFYFKSNAEVHNAILNSPTPSYVIQPYIHGDAASVSCIMHQGEAYVLSCNKQLLEVENNRFYYQGFIVNGMAQYWHQLANLAKQVANVLPDLNGYVGLDVIVSHSDDERVKVTLVEINPRLTTTYSLLAEAIGANPAGLIIDVLTQENYQLPIIQRNQVNMQVKHA